MKNNDSSRVYAVDIATTSMTDGWKNPAISQILKDENTKQTDAVSQDNDSSIDQVTEINSSHLNETQEAIQKDREAGNNLGATGNHKKNINKQSCMLCRTCLKTTRVAYGAGAGRCRQR